MDANACEGWFTSSTLSTWIDFGIQSTSHIFSSNPSFAITECATLIGHKFLGLSVTKLVWTLLMWAPLACSAQVVNNPVAPDRTADPSMQLQPKTNNYQNLGQGYAGALDQVRDRLELTAPQQQLWRAYEASIDAYNGLHYREMPVVSAQGDKAPRQIGRLVDNLQNRLAALEDVEQASKQLYAGLTAAQQTTADQLLLATVPMFMSNAGNVNPSQGPSGRSDSTKRSRRGSGSGVGF